MGTVGPPGQRVFFLQARRGTQVVTLRLEKVQVAALVEELASVLAQLPPAGPLPTDLELTEPVVAEWVVRALGLAFDPDEDRFVLLAEELVPGAGEGEGEAGVEGVPGLDPTEQPGPEPASARFRLTREQAAGLSMRGASVVVAGRAPCPLCGGPLDPEGHACPRLNGNRSNR